MGQKENRLDDVKALYDQLKFTEEINEAKEEDRVEIYNKNQELSEHIVNILEEVLNEEPLDKDALFWKIKIYNGPHFEDTSLMLSICEEIVEKLKEDKKAVMSAYDWMAWIYDNKLELKEKAIEVLHDKLIEVSLIEDDYSLRDREFGETYYMIAFLYRELEDFDTAISFYKLSHEHFPDHYYASYQGGRLLLERECFDEAFPFLKAYTDFHGNEYTVTYAKEIEAFHNEGKLANHWNLILLMYSIGLSRPTEFGAKNVKEYGMKYLPLIEEELEKNSSNNFAMRMKALHYIYVEKNTKKAFESLEHNYKSLQAIKGPLYFTFYELGAKLDIDVEKFDYPFELNGFYGYNLMTRFLEQAGEYRGEGEKEKALKYYQIAQKIGLNIYDQVEDYFTKGIGDKANNNAHGFAMICNNLGIVIRNVGELSDEQDYTKDIYKKAIELHKKGYEYSPFWENMESGIRMATLVKDYESVDFFAKELLTFHSPYSEGWMSVKGTMMKNLILANEYEKALEFYSEIKDDFEKQKIEDEDIVGEMIYLAAEFFTYIRFKREDYLSTIAFTEDFFSNPVYFELREDLANINYWFSLAWCYHGLENRDEAAKYFTLMIDNFEGGEYQSSIDEIPNEYRLGKIERNAFERLDCFWKRDCNSTDEYPLKDYREDYITYFERIREEIMQGQHITVEKWISDNIHLKVEGRHQRENSSEIIFESLFDFYFQEQNITIRFNLDEREEVIRSFFGLKSKKEWTKLFEVYFYHYSEGESTSNDAIAYHKEKKEFQLLAQELWNDMVRKISN
ncbi:hypothetical protein NWE55_02805 [Myroides albus]|uniref:Uncharacterized protein n=1 Tax=Myroides albus TaxID=2562892 RepID=A0A6I3LHC1_9FLAO|nr:hypothetical protein [Myroides albus]MTG98969.1 hypothetical protein [Myroides albus]UVD80230.1 hypothetical protein NWE55_02805 [Myroides albus]